MQTTLLPPELPQHTISLPAKRLVTLIVNGEEKQLELAPWTTLLDALREYMNLTGTKKAVIMDSVVPAPCWWMGSGLIPCLTLAIMKEGADITTIEGIASEGDGSSLQLHPLQAAFIEHDAYQCGYCTPGQICSAVGLINEGRVRTADDIRELMSGNICRCGAYPHIVDAISEVMQIATKA